MLMVPYLIRFGICRMVKSVGRLGRTVLQQVRGKSGYAGAQQQVTQNQLHEAVSHSGVSSAASDLQQWLA
jgi:hypothetical protein